jgi:hypothetical protein
MGDKYPIEWVSGLNLNPTFEQYRDALKRMGLDPDTTKIEPTNWGTTFQDGKGYGIGHGGIVSDWQIPSIPNLPERDEIYYDCGCTWGVDLDGNRYHKIRKGTNVPYKFGELIDQFIIMAWLYPKEHQKVSRIVEKYSGREEAI